MVKKVMGPWEKRQRYETLIGVNPPRWVRFIVNTMEKPDNIMLNSQLGESKDLGFGELSFEPSEHDGYEVVLVLHEEKHVAGMHTYMQRVAMYLDEVNPAYLFVADLCLERWVSPSDFYYNGVKLIAYPRPQPYQPNLL